MGSTDAAWNAWNDLNDAVLSVFTTSDPRSTGEVERALPDVPRHHVRAALNHNADLGYLAAVRGAVYWTYRITETGKSRLADSTKAMA